MKPNKLDVQVEKLLNDLLAVLPERDYPAARQAVIAAGDDLINHHQLPQLVATNLAETISLQVISGGPKMPKQASDILHELRNLRTATNSSILVGFNSIMPGV